MVTHTVDKMKNIAAGARNLMDYSYGLQFIDCIGISSGRSHSIFDLIITDENHERQVSHPSSRHENFHVAQKLSVSGAKYGDKLAQYTTP